MVSYLYGVRFNVDAIAKLCQKHDILLVEDIAEDYRGPKENGHPEAALSVFSFGTIKIDTAFGGGIGVVRNQPDLYNRMMQAQFAYP